MDNSSENNKDIEDQNQNNKNTFSIDKPLNKILVEFRNINVLYIFMYR